MAEKTNAPTDPIKTTIPADAIKTGDSPEAAKPALSPDAIEAEIAETRARLASTIDELTIRAQPREILRRQKESARARLVEATHTPEGDLRVERIAAIAAAASALFAALAILHRRHRRG